MNKTKSLLPLLIFPISPFPFSPIPLFVPRTHLRISLHYISATFVAFPINPCK